MMNFDKNILWQEGSGENKRYTFQNYNKLLFM